jgi:NDP-sugar pyrophosphorylase family protein
MKVLLMASSEGTSLAPLTSHQCAALLPIAGKPAVVHALEAIAGAGFTEATVAVSPHAEQVRKALGDGVRWGMRLRFVATWPGEHAASVARRVRHDGDADWLVVNGAVVRSPAVIKAMADAVLPTPETHLAAQVDGRWAGVDRIGPAALPGAIPDEPGSRFTWASSGTPVACAGALNLMDSPAAYHDGNLRAAAGQIDGLIIPGLERCAGLRTGRHSTVPVTAVRGTRIFAGAAVRVHPSAELGDDVVLGDDVLVDRGATLTRTVVLPNSYIGEAVCLTDAIVCGQTLIRVDHGAVTHVSDEFLLADITRQPLGKAASKVASRLAGAVMLIVSAPLWVLAIAWSLAVRPSRPLQVVTLLGNRESAGPDGHPQRREFSTPEFAAGAPIVKHLPRLWAVLTGDLSLIGVSPLSPGAAEARAEEWERVRDEAPVGLLGPGQLLGDGSLDERYLLEAVYARTRTPWTDVMWLLRSAKALMGSHAWIAGGHE